MPSAPLILPFANIQPDIAGPLLHAGQGSAVLGRVTLGRNAWLGALSVIRADGHFVTVGDDFHLGARSTLHINHEIHPCIVGDRVAVGRSACVHACVVGSDVVIGDGVVILDGAVVEDNVVLEPGSTVFPNKRVPSGFLYAGSPAKPVRALGAGELAERRATQQAVPDDSQPRAAATVASAAGSDVHPSVFIASTAVVRGRLVAAESSSVWFSNHLDAGEATISIGPRTNIQDNTVIRCTTEQGVSIGHSSTVGHNVTINDCVIGSQTLVGIGSTVAPGTTIGDRVLLAASARTTPGQVLESGWLYAGNPARKFARLDDAKQALTALIVIRAGVRGAGTASTSWALTTPLLHCFRYLAPARRPPLAFHSSVLGSLRRRIRGADFMVRRKSLRHVQRRSVAAFACAFDLGLSRRVQFQVSQQRRDTRASCVVGN